MPDPTSSPWPTAWAGAGATSRAPPSSRLVGLDDEALSGRELSQALLDRILAANAELGDQVRADPGSTAWARPSSRCCAPATRSSSRTSATRAFMARDGVVTQITKDHSFVQNPVDEGRISARRPTPIPSARS